MVLYNPQNFREAQTASVIKMEGDRGQKIYSAAITKIVLHQEVRAKIIE